MSNNSADILTLSAAWIAAISAVASAGITYLVYASQVLPDVIVYVEEDLAKPNILMIVVKNIGKGVAHNVRFRLSHAIKLRTFMGLDGKDMINGPLIDGIPFLAPGAERRLVWGMYGGIHKQYGDACIQVICSFDAKHALVGVPYRIERDSLLEVGSFAAGDIGDRTHMKCLVNGVEKVAAAIQDLNQATLDGFKDVSRRIDSASSNIRNLR